MSAATDGDGYLYRHPRRGGHRLACILPGPRGAPFVILTHCFAADRHFWTRQLPP